MSLSIMREGQAAMSNKQDINQARIDSLRWMMNSLQPWAPTRLTDKQIAAELIKADTALYGAAALRPTDGDDNDR